MEFELPEDSPTGWTVLAASGDIDVTSSHILRNELARLIEVGDSKVIVDLGEVDFIDSTGLGILVGAAALARRDDGDIRIACSNTRLLKVISMAGLDDHFAKAESVDEAAAAPDPVAAGSGEV